MGGCSSKGTAEAVRGGSTTSGKGTGEMHYSGPPPGSDGPTVAMSTDHEDSDGTSVGDKSENRKTMKHSKSVIGLDSMIEERREEGGLKSNVVHIEVPFGKPIDEVYAGVHNGPVLGSGNLGLVRLVTHKATGVKCAVKCLDLGLIKTDLGLQQLREEIYIMCQLDHPNIVRLEEVYESHNEIYLVQELCLGGELFDRLDKQPDDHYTEQQCARLVKQMLSAVRYIHKQGIVHRDLKLENFIFSTTSPDSELKMIDFGLSKHFTHGELQHELVGTLYTVSPEVIRCRYDERCDVWAIGVITFLLLSGYPPFGGCGGPEPLTTVRSNILRGSFQFEPEEIWVNVSQQARDFISSLLVTNPAKRPSAVEAQKDPWLLEWANSEKRRNEGAGRLNPNVAKALVGFKEYSDMRKLLCEVLSFTMLPEQIQDLRAEFEKMDTDGSGEISLSALKTVLMQNADAGDLGALTEEEVEDIFNAMRIQKSEPTIRWHEFIAAGLSQCEVDDRNLRLAFDRLDSDHKEFITFDDVLDLMGSDGTEETLRTMYQDSLHMCKCQHARIMYEDFLLLMKGQTNREGPPGMVVPHSPVVSLRRRPKNSAMEQLEEDGFSLEDSGEGAAADVGKGGGTAGVIPLMPTISPHGPVSLSRRSLQMVRETSSGEDSERVANVALKMGPSGSVAVAGSNLTKGVAALASVDKGEGELPNVTANIELAMRRELGSSKEEADAVRQAGLPQPEPSTPPRAIGIYSSPITPRLSAPSRRSPLSGLLRKPSKSYDTSNSSPCADYDDSHLVTPADSRRCVVLPEHLHDNAIVEGLIKDESKTPLVANRELYRAHRQMRLAILEASKRFEEKQLLRAQKELRDKAKGNGEAPAEDDAGKVVAAGLVMWHGQRSSRQLSMETSGSL